MHHGSKRRPASSPSTTSMPRRNASKAAKDAAADSNRGSNRALTIARPWATVAILVLATCCLVLFVVLARPFFFVSAPSSRDAYVLVLNAPLVDSDATATILEHYAQCASLIKPPRSARLGAMRVVASASGSWHLRDVHDALMARSSSTRHRKAEPTPSITVGSNNPLVTKLLNADASPYDALVFVSTNAVMRDCAELEALVHVWLDGRTSQIIGTSPLAHAMVPEDASILSTGWPRYKVTHSLAQTDGRYSMMALDHGACVDKRFIAELLEHRDPVQEDTAASCGHTDMLLNYYVSQRTSLPAVHVELRGSKWGRKKRLVDQSASLANQRSECVTRLARLKSGKLPFVWSDATVVAGVDELVVAAKTDIDKKDGGAAATPSTNARGHTTPDHAFSPPPPPPSSTTLQKLMGKLQMIDHPEGLQRRFMLHNDWLAGVAVVITMETRPNEAASAVRHLHDRYPFVREAVVWNNFNLTMNHHMFPYDEIYVRYIMAPQDYGAYAKYLGCLLARYDICYFQQEKMRPSALVGPLYNAFLLRPDAVAATVEAQTLLDHYNRLSVGWTGGVGGGGLAASAAHPHDATTGFAMMHYLDLMEGAMVHKDRVRAFVDALNQQADQGNGVGGGGGAGPPDDEEGALSSSSLSLDTKAKLADLMFVYSQPTEPTLLPHTVRTNLPKRDYATFPTSADISVAASFAARCRLDQPSSGSNAVDPLSQIFAHARAPCSNGRCAFVTSIDTWLLAATSMPTTANDLSTEILAVTTHKFEANQTYWAAVDGNLKTSWKARLPEAAASFVGLELVTSTLITGVRLWTKAEIKPTPVLQLRYYGDLVYQPASPSACQAGKWATDGELKVLRYECTMPLRVTRVRLVIHAMNQPLELAELQIDSLASPLLDDASRFAHDLSLYDPTAASAKVASNAANSAAVAAYPAAPALGGKIVYVLSRAELLLGTTLAFVEEACEMSRLYPGNVTLVYASSMPQRAIAESFAVVGSTCQLDSAQLQMHSLDQTTTTTTTTMGTGDGEHSSLLTWWLSDPLIASTTKVVVFSSSSSSSSSSSFDGNSANVVVGSLIRHRDKFAADTVFVARSFGQMHGLFQEVVNLADGVLVASQREYIAHVQGQNFKGQDVRLAYPLRMLPANPAILQTPTTPAVEEIVVLVTAATTERDLALFSANVPHIVQRKADVRIANVTTMQMQLTRRTGSTTDERVMAPKWRTVKDVVYYVSIYPSRVLWILDASVGSAYYASMASIEGARFIAHKLAIPHTQSRMLAWNATCEWTPECFQGKAWELVNAEYNASSSFIDKERLRADAFDLVVEEWPIKRLFAPFANTIAQVVQYAAELISGHEMRRAHSLSEVESVLI